MVVDAVPRRRTAAFRRGTTLSWRLAVWLVMLGLAIAAVPLSPGWQLSLLSAAAAGPPLLAWRAADQSDEPARRVWRPIGAGLTALWLGSLGVAAYYWANGVMIGPATAVDVLDLIGYVLCLIGLFRMLPSDRRRDATLKYDLAILACGLFACTKEPVLDAAVHRTRLGLHYVIMVGYPLLDMTLLVAVAAVVLSYRRLPRSRQLILVSILLLLATDVANAALSQRGSTVGWVSLGWIAATLAMGGAGVHSSRTEIGDADYLASTATRRLVALALAMFALVISTVSQYVVHHELDIVDVGVIASVMTCLVLRRLQLTIAAEREAHQHVAAQHRFQSALLAQAPGTVLVLTRDGKISFGAGAGSLWPTKGMPDWLMLVHPADRGRAATLLAKAGAGPAKAELRMKVAAGFRLTEVTATDALNDGAVDGYVLNARDIEERREYENRLFEQANTDVLTGLANRRRFLACLERALASPSAGGHALLVGDLNRFKAVNDAFGHQTGDQLLREIGDRLRACCPPPAVVARLGGDEFAVLTPLAADEGGLIPLMHRITRAASLPMVADGQELAPRMSLGGVALEPGDSVEAAQWKADAALYEAKRSRLGSTVFDSDMAAQARRRVTLQQDLRTAIPEGRLHLMYQPIIDADNGELRAAEALLRWQHPEYGAIPPPEIISAAEDTGLIGLLGRWVLRAACREAATWGASGPGVAVNISATHLAGPSVVRDVAEALAASGLPAHALTLEITETIFVDAETSLDTLKRLKQLGVRIAIDDFGTGYSSLSYLQQLPVDQLKIDRSFVARLAETQTQALIEMLLALARTLRLEVVAEGVETSEQHDWLRRHAPLQLQGYLFSRPQPAHTLRRLFGATGATVPAARSKPPDTFAPAVLQSLERRPAG